MQDEAGYQVPSQRQSDLYDDGAVPGLSVHGRTSTSTSTSTAEYATPLEYATIDTLKAGTAVPSSAQSTNGAGGHRNLNASSA